MKFFQKIKDKYKERKRLRRIKQIKEHREYIKFMKEWEGFDYIRRGGF